MTKPNPPSFGRSGRPRKISFSDLFLWDTSIELELTGVSITELVGETSPKLLSLYQDIRRKRKISIERAKDTVPSALAEIGFPLADEYRKALNGEASTVTELGNWCAYIYSRSMKPNGEWPPKITALGHHIIEIEEALKEPTRAWQNDDMNRCVDLLEACPVIAEYLWPEAITKLRSPTRVEEITCVRLMVMLELQLSYLAGWDAQIHLDGYSNGPQFEMLLPDFSAEKPKHPNALFFSWLATYSGTKSKLASKIHQISKPAKDTDIASTKRQLRRWKNGGGFPSLDMLDALFISLYGHTAREKGDPKHYEWALSWAMALAAKRINFLMLLLAPIAKLREQSFPFGHETVQEWREKRYPYWYRHWLPLLEKRE